MFVRISICDMVMRVGFASSMTDRPIDQMEVSGNLTCTTTNTTTTIATKSNSAIAALVPTTSFNPLRSKWLRHTGRSQGFVLCWDSKRFNVVAAQARVAIERIRARARRARSGRWSWEEGLRNIVLGIVRFEMLGPSDRCWEGLRRKDTQSISVCTQVVIQEETPKPSRTGNDRSGRLAGRTDASSGLPISTLAALHTNHASRANHTAPTHNTLESDPTPSPTTLVPLKARRISHGA
jgi:hypothetical protein